MTARNPYDLATAMLYAQQRRAADVLRRVRHMNIIRDIELRMKRAAARGKLVE